MNNFKPEQIKDSMPEYWEGNQNILIRLWTYTKVGLNQVNDFKYVVVTIFGIYYTLKLINPLWLVWMFAVCLPILCYVGHWWLYKGAKTSEFVQTKRGSVIGYSGFNIQVRQLELLEEIAKKLNDQSIK